VSRIDRVYIAVHRKDLRLARICVASVRHWYPEIPIYLLKDEVYGPFSTRELEERWNVSTWPTGNMPFGWGFVKLEPLFAEERVRYLMLDADIVFVGRVIDALEIFEADFVVQEEVQPPSDIPGLYFDSRNLPAVLKRTFPMPRFTFNSGQYVATAGLLCREDFAQLVHWTNPRLVRHRDVFNQGDQGVLNYVVLTKLEAGAITVDRTPFMKWGTQEMGEIDLRLINAESPYPYVLHWAGLKKLQLRKMIRADILDHFERAYYARIPQGWARLRLRIARSEVERWRSRFSRLITRVIASARASRTGTQDA